MLVEEVKKHYGADEVLDIRYSANGQPLSAVFKKGGFEYRASLQPVFYSLHAPTSSVTFAEAELLSCSSADKGPSLFAQLVLEVSSLLRWLLGPAKR